jgi:hypothetical protein
MKEHMHFSILLATMVPAIAVRVKTATLQKMPERSMKIAPR